MNKKARKIFKDMVKNGFVVSVWRDKKRRKFACEMSRPSWAGSCATNGHSISKAITNCALQVEREAPEEIELKRNCK